MSAVSAGDLVDERYRVIGALGAGGMGEVYLADDLGRGGQIALKLLPVGDRLHADALPRFQREAELAARVDTGGGVVRVHSAGMHRGRPYCAMEVVRGGTLEERLRTGVALEDGLGWIASLARVLARLHAEGVVHRDVKPTNVLFDEEGRVKLCDFGLAYDLSVEERLTLSSEVLGTPSYMAPEQVLTTEVGPQVDVYPLGVMLYRIACGRLPFEGNPMSVLDRLAREDPPPPSALTPNVDRKLEALIVDAMHRDPQRRSSASELADALDAYQAGAQRGRGHSKRLAIGAAALLIALLGWLAYEQAQAGPSRGEVLRAAANALTDAQAVGLAEVSSEEAARLSEAWRLSELEPQGALAEAHARLRAWDLARRADEGQAVELAPRRESLGALYLIVGSRICLERGQALQAQRWARAAVDASSDAGPRALAQAAGRRALLHEHLQALDRAVETGTLKPLSARELSFFDFDAERDGPAWAAARQARLDEQVPAWIERLDTPDGLALLSECLTDPAPTSPGPRLLAALNAKLVEQALALRAQKTTDPQALERLCERYDAYFTLAPALAKWSPTNRALRVTLFVVLPPGWLPTSEALARACLRVGFRSLHSSTNEANLKVAHGLGLASERARETRARAYVRLVHVPGSEHARLRELALAAVDGPGDDLAIVFRAEALMTAAKSLVDERSAHGRPKDALPRARALMERAWAFEIPDLNTLKRIAHYRASVEVLAAETSADQAAALRASVDAFQQRAAALKEAVSAPELARRMGEVTSFFRGTSRQAIQLRLHAEAREFAERGLELALEDRLPADDLRAELLDSYPAPKEAYARAKAGKFPLPSASSPSAYLRAWVRAFAPEDPTRTRELLSGYVERARKEEKIRRAFRTAAKAGVFVEGAESLGAED